MTIGWIRAYTEEDKSVDSKVPYFNREQRAQFRLNFRAGLHKTKSDASLKLANLKWGDSVELPSGLSTTLWTRVTYKTKTGYVKNEHLVELGFVKKRKGSTEKSYCVDLDSHQYNEETGKLDPVKKKILWGDFVQIISRGPKRSYVRVRGIFGKMDTSDITEKGLLEIYFIDVGQGDGVLVKTPDHKHILIDAGLTRRDQQTGKNASDFVDWKFFFDYGDHRIHLDSLMASHSDIDHYGGLHDLLRDTKLANRELDCNGVDIGIFHHPGLSRWTNIKDADPAHADGLGPKLNDGFIRLLGNRDDAQNATDGTSAEQLSGPWKKFIADVLKNSAKTKVAPVMVARNRIKNGDLPPLLWKSAEGCEIQVLAPVNYMEGDKVALPDLGVRSKNTNGHSICIRLKYGKSRILLTGDLNTKSMHWIEESYDDRMGLFKSDVAKACHHGSEDISYRFLEAVNAAATVISSGDSEGYSHPRPEVAAASACSGYRHIDRKKDKLKTPLLYMTEIERSVTLGAINRMDIKGLKVGGNNVEGTILGRYVDEIDPKGFLSPEDRKKLKGLNKSDSKKAIKKAREAGETEFGLVEGDTASGDTRIDFNLSVPLGPVDQINTSRRGWRARLMQKTHYGLVNVRTDGETIMCATLDETDDDWIIHHFPARFSK